jgi:hypothetical protein
MNTRFLFHSAIVPKVRQMQTVVGQRDGHERLVYQSRLLNTQLCRHVKVFIDRTIFIHLESAKTHH